MRLIKKINNKKLNPTDSTNIKKSSTVGLTYFKMAEHIFNDNKNDFKKIYSINNINDLNCYYVIDYNNIVRNIVDYNKIFHQKQEINKSALNNEYNKLINYLSNRRNNKKYPSVFLKLGLANEVSGCYLVLSNKQNIKNLKIELPEHKNKIQMDESYVHIMVQINFSSNEELPEEIHDLCTNFNKKKSKEYNDIINDNIKDFNNIQDIKNHIAKIHDATDHFISPTEPFKENKENIDKNNNTDNNNNNDDDIIFSFKYPFFMPLDVNAEFDPSSFLNTDSIFVSTANNANMTIEDMVEKNLININNVDFLHQVIKTAETNENYELCAKIRDRISQIIKLK